MAIMKTIDTALREAGIDPERWREAIDAISETEYVDYALACDVADALTGGGASPELDKEIIEVARERWPADSAAA